MRIYVSEDYFWSESAKRGYSAATVSECVVGRHGQYVIIDNECPNYPHPKEGGPGTELKALLKTWFGIQATPNCSCNARAKEMDERGVEWCESPEGMATILGWLREQAEARKLPFVELGAKILVKRAISAAKRKQADTK